MIFKGLINKLIILKFGAKVDNLREMKRKKNKPKDMAIKAKEDLKDKQETCKGCGEPSHLVTYNIINIT